MGKFESWTSEHLRVSYATQEIVVTCHEFLTTARDDSKMTSIHQWWQTLLAARFMIGHTFGSTHGIYSMRQRWLDFLKETIFIGGYTQHVGSSLINQGLGGIESRLQGGLYTTNSTSPEIQMWGRNEQIVVTRQFVLPPQYAFFYFRPKHLTLTIPLLFSVH